MTGCAVFNLFVFGADYFIDNRNTITLTQDFGKGRFTTMRTQDQEYLESSRVFSTMETAWRKANLHSGEIAQDLATSIVSRNRAGS